MSVQIYAGNLSYTMTDDSLRKVFEQFGEVSSAKIIRDRESGRSKGFGFIEMSNGDEANAAIEKLNGTDVDGRNVKVNIAKPKRRN